MPIMKLVAVRDRAVNAFGQVVTVPHVGQAIRSFGDEVNQPNTPVNQHPEDYDLYELADYDTDTGMIKPLETPHMLTSGKSLVKGQ